MNRTVLGAFAALLLAAAGMFWWQGRAASEMGEAPPKLADLPADAMLPDETGEGLSGTLPPEASEATREQRRFDRLDRNRDSKITRVEILATDLRVSFTTTTNHIYQLHPTTQSSDPFQFRSPFKQLPVYFQPRGND